MAFKQKLKRRRNLNPDQEEQEMIYPIVPSPFDPRDYKYETLNQMQSSNVKVNQLKFINKDGLQTLKVPETLDLRAKMEFPRSQGNRGTCAAFSAAAIKEYQERIDINFQDYMSPEFIYFYRENKPNPGMFCRDIMKILQKRGCVPETLLPYRDGDPETLPEECIAEAEKYKIASYASISTIDGLKEALCLHGPCLIAFPVYSTRPQFWRPASPEDPRTGGHAVCVVGYNKEGFILRNSWGSLWNGNGHVVYPYSEFGKHWEIWCCTDVESDIWLPDPSVAKKCLKLLGCFLGN